MGSRLTIEEEITYGTALKERKQQANVESIEQKAEAREEAETRSRLSTAEKVMFALAAAFSAVILVIGVFLTIVGFIFSPITETMVFGLMTGAFGMTFYVIWRGGRS